MKTSEQTDKIDAAMTKVQAALAPITKNKVVDTSRDGGSGGWKSGYTTLDALYSAVHDLLAEHRVVIYQGGDFVQGVGAVLVKPSAHEGHWVGARRAAPGGVERCGRRVDRDRSRA
jgi:hypothetical protein